MNYLRLSTLTFTSLLALSACGKSEDTIAERSTDSAASNSLLSYVPTDTPYLMANLEEAPDDVIKDLWKLAQPGLDSIQASFNKANAELEAGTTTAADNPEAQLAHSLFSELDGNLSPEGLEELGFDTNPEYAMYGLGAFPVVRVGLSNSETLRATILRSLAKAGIADSEQEYQGVSFWRLSDDEPGEVPAGVYVSILDSHLAIGIFPIMAEPELLPLFLGLEMPENNDALSRLKKLNKTHGYTAYGSGILDLHRLADQFIRPGTTAARMMAATGEFDPASLTQECVTEIHQIIDNAPMMTMGSTEVSSAAIAVQYRVEMPETLAQKLIGLVSKIPVADEVSDRILEFAFGMRFGPVRDFLLEKATSIVEQPYQCEHLQKLNEQAVASLEKLNQPMPPFVNNFRGIRVSLTELMMNLDSIPENARGHLAVHVEQPQMFVGMAQMFLPDLAELALAPGDSPVLLPESLTQKPGIVAYAAMTDDAIGLAVGEGEDAGLPEFLNRKVGPEGTFLSANYDFETYYNYSDRLMDPSDYGHDQHDDEDNGHAQAAIEFREASRAAMIKMMDRNSTKMRFTTDGLVIDNRVTFKQ